MLKSVWLSDLTVSSLNDAGSVLSSYYRHLNGLIGANECILSLSEPDGGGSTCLLISERTTCLLPIDAMNADPAAIQRVMKNRSCEFSDGRLYAPLYFENIASFGALVFGRTGINAVPDGFRDALVAFSSVLYSESMGSIIRSFHPTVMRAENVCVDYRQGKLVNRVVKNVSLEINEKEFTIIVGASGSGKSSLLNVLGGMLTASSGTVWWHDTAISRMSEKERTAYRGNTVGFVFQRYNLISDLTAEENVRIAASLVDDPLPVSEVLEMVGMADKARSYPSQLSGGEQQRVCIARALVKRARLLLCDEPTGALDTDNAAQIIRILKSIAKDQGIPVVVITHNPSLVVLADHCITISNGTIADDRLQPFSLPAEELRLK